MWKEVDKAVYGEEVGDLLCTVVGLGQVNVEISHEDRSVLGVALKCFFKVGQVRKGVWRKVDSDKQGALISGHKYAAEDIGTVANEGFKAQFLVLGSKMKATPP